MKKNFEVVIRDDYLDFDGRKDYELFKDILDYYNGGLDSLAKHYKLSDCYVSSNHSGNSGNIFFFGLTHIEMNTSYWKIVADYDEGRNEVKIEYFELNGSNYYHKIEDMKKIADDLMNATKNVEYIFDEELPYLAENTYKFFNKELNDDCLVEFLR